MPDSYVIESEAGQTIVFSVAKGKRGDQARREIQRSSAAGRVRAITTREAFELTRESIESGSELSSVDYDQEFTK